jgi:hypothetical protein
VGELEDFLTPTLTRQFEAEQALINGDPEPRRGPTEGPSSTHGPLRNDPSSAHRQPD